MCSTQPPQLCRNLTEGTFVRHWPSSSLLLGQTTAHLWQRAGVKMNCISVLGGCPPGGTVLLTLPGRPAASIQRSRCSLSRHGPCLKSPVFESPPASALCQDSRGQLPVGAQKAQPSTQPTSNCQQQPFSFPLLIYQHHCPSREMRQSTENTNCRIQN